MTAGLRRRGSALALRVLGPLGLATFGVVVALALAEVVARLVTPPREPLPTPRPFPRDVHVVATIAEMAAPNVRGVLANGVPYRTNSSGVRGREYARPKPPNVFRIAVIGDSVAMGAGVAEEDTYAARLERALTPATDRPYEVLNLGIGGLNAAAVVSRFERVGLPYEPDLAIYGYTLNDIEGRAYRHSMDAAVAQDATRVVRDDMTRRGLYVTRFLRTRLFSLRELLWPPRGSYVWELDDNYFHNPEAWSELDAAFGRLETLAKQRGICVLVLQHTSLTFLHALHPFRPHYAAISRLAAAHGFCDRPTLDYFRGRDALALWVNFFDPHPNAAGHAILAQAALDGLHALPVECWKRH